MDRPPSAPPLPLPKPGEAIAATAFAGALGLATWACVPFVAFVPALIPVVALVVVPLAFHWLRFGLATAKNSPERGFTLPSSSTAVRIGVGAFAYAPLATGTICAVVPAFLRLRGDLAYQALVCFFIGATVGVLLWGPATVVAIGAYGLPLRAATATMDATYPDVVDRALVRTLRRLALAATLAVILAAGLRVGRGEVFSWSARLGSDLAIDLPSIAVFVLLAAAAIAVPARAALRAHRRLEARKARIGNDLHLVPLPPGTRIRRNQLPILGEAVRPTHALVRVAAAGNYRVAEAIEEPVALVAVAEDARATDTPAKAR